MLTIVAAIDCPHCGESSELSIDRTEARRQEWVLDCEVCCRPIRVTARLGRRLLVRADSLDAA